MPLPCQHEQTQPALPGSEAYWSRVRFALSHNVDRACREFPNNVGFLTLTVGDWRDGKFHGIECPKECNRRFNSVRRHLASWLRMKMGVVVMETHDSGNWHYHLLVVVGSDIRRGYDQQAVANRDYKKGANRNLRAIWGRLRKSLPGFGFGRHELLPVHKLDRAGNYLGKYLTKDFRSVPLPSHVKRLNRVRWLSWQDRLRPRGWSWATRGGQIHRTAVKTLATLCRIRQSEYAMIGGRSVAVHDHSAELKSVLGPRWCFHLWQIYLAWKATETGPHSFVAGLACFAAKQSDRIASRLDFLNAGRVAFELAELSRNPATVVS